VIGSQLQRTTSIFEGRQTCERCQQMNWMDDLTELCIETAPQIPKNCIYQHSVKKDLRKRKVCFDCCLKESCEFYLPFNFSGKKQDILSTGENALKHLVVDRCKEHLNRPSRRRDKVPSCER
jgi:hypothetical protein